MLRAPQYLNPALLLTVLPWPSVVLEVAVCCLGHVNNKILLID